MAEILNMTEKQQLSVAASSVSATTDTLKQIVNDNANTKNNSSDLINPIKNLIETNCQCEILKSNCQQQTSPPPIQYQQSKHQLPCNNVKCVKKSNHVNQTKWYLLCNGNNDSDNDQISLEIPIQNKQRTSSQSTKKRHSWHIQEFSKNLL